MVGRALAADFSHSVCRILTHSALYIYTHFFQIKDSIDSAQDGYHH